MKSHEHIYQLLDNELVYYEPTADDNGFERPAPRKEGESDRAYLQRIGFDYKLTTSDPLIWFRRVRGEGHEYLAVWQEVNETSFIFVFNWPDLLKLRTLVAPVLQTHYLQQMLERRK
jgi:hypothetical protein